MWMDGWTNRRTDRHDEANSSFSQLVFYTRLQPSLALYFHNDTLLLYLISCSSLCQVDFFHSMKQKPSWKANSRRADTSVNTKDRSPYWETEVVQLAKKFPGSYVSRRLITYPQVPATGTCTELDDVFLHHFSKICFYTIIHFALGLPN
jgi:hypothetical protein